MTHVVVILLFILTSLAVFLLTRKYYLQRLEEIRLMSLSLSQGINSSRLAINHRSSHDIAIILNETARRFNIQLKEVSDEKNKFEAILSSMTEGVIVVNANGKLQHISPNVQHMLELRSTQWGDRPYWEIIRHQHITETIKEAFKDKKALRREIIDLSSDKTYFNMQISPVLTPDGDIISIVAVLHDITELKQLELMRAEFVANVSHELKTPLTSIKGYVETLKEAVIDDPQSVDKFLDIIQRQTTNLENLVNDLLILSSLESSSVKMEFVSESLNQVIDNFLLGYKKIMDASGHQFKILIQDNLPTTIFDRLRIEQVLINLLDNAIKFTPRGGEIVLAVIVENSFIRIDVKDSGVGIPSEHLSRVFERFYRIDKARSRESGGTGLGLAIVHQIMVAHQGKVEVKSYPGQGSTFSVFLPLKRA